MTLIQANSIDCCCRKKSGDLSLSIVTSLFNSSDFIDEFIQRIIRVAENVCPDFELIIVDDGSPDDSLKKAISHAEIDTRITVVELARNFGHHAALLTGISLARGERVFLIDSDLEEPPELLDEFSSLLGKEGVDVVYGFHDQAVGGLGRRVSSKLFWSLFNLLSRTKTRPNICNVRLMNRTYVNALTSLPEREVFLGGLYSWPGFRQTGVRVNRQIKRSRTTYTVYKRFSLMVRSVVSFSSRPLQMIFWVGLFMSIISAAIGLYFTFLKLVEPTRIVSGFTALIVSIWFVGGMIMASLGLIGIYMSSLYTEVKGRPRTIIRRVYQNAGKVE